MFSLMKRVGIAAVLGSAALAVLAPSAHGQVFQVRPGLSLQQSAALTAGIVNQVARNPFVAAAAVNPLGAAASFNSNPLGGLGAASLYGSGAFSSPYGGYGGYGGYYEDPFGAYLRGGASVITAQGRFMVNEQQSFQMREQTRQAMIETRRKALDEFLYERERTPTAEDERQRFLREQYSRSRNNPPITEVWSGKALNDVLADLRRQAGKSDTAVLRTFPIPLDEEGLKHINVTASEGRGNIGLLKNEGRLSWPAALSGAELRDDRERIGALTQEAVKQAEFNGQVDAGTIRQLTNDVARLRKDLRISGNDLPVNQYIEAKSFLDNLDSAITALQQRDVGNYFTGKYAIKAKTVPELIKQMSDRGLQFAAALPGDEASYTALHQALAAYDNASRPDTADR